VEVVEGHVVDFLRGDAHLGELLEYRREADEGLVDQPRLQAAERT